MNKSIIIRLFSGMFPGAETIEFNFVDGKIVTTNAGGEKDFPLGKEDSQPTVMLLKDYLNIKGEITHIKIDMGNENVNVIHTNGTKML